MKKTSRIHYYYLFLSIILLHSCAPTNKYYYQVYKTQTGNGKIVNSQIVFDEPNIDISYNLWDNDGNSGFTVYNKSKFDIVLHLDKSFFVLNGVAYDYFKNRTYTLSSNSAAAQSVTSYPYWFYGTQTASDISSYGYSTAVSESKTITIPSGTSKFVKEYKITNKLYQNCSLYVYPNSKNIMKLFFDSINTPINFYNTIAYSIGHKDSIFKSINRFYVNEIINYPYSQIIREEYKVNCNVKSDFKVPTFIDATPDKFYHRYLFIDHITNQEYYEH